MPTTPDQPRTPPPRTALRLPPRPWAVVELPRWGFVKRAGDGRIDFVSPVPCPYNYGSLPGLGSGDGDALDVLLVGPRLPRGTRVRWPVRGVLGFVDAGAFDPKVVCSEAPLGPIETAALGRFCRIYAVGKGALQGIRGRPGATHCLGWLPWRRAD
ncbi:MAG TPA: inorganic diphosphatase [Polyangiaceae bacterium LLY-WYZ-14_1]|nr:inorganic diphosphatase [Polyangiaceae bacterium LLY-WYZ-14_1]